MTATSTEATDKAALARLASRSMSAITTDQKNEALERIASALIDDESKVLETNEAEVIRGQKNGLEDSFIERMTLNSHRLTNMAEDTRRIATLPDPVGEVFDTTTRPNGLQIGRIRVPLGVIGAVYESRPNITIDIAALCIKSGNAVVLRSGTDAHETSSILAGIVSRETKAAGFPSGAVQFIESTHRDQVGALLNAQEHIDLMVPRGGSDLIERVRDEARMPVVTGGIGVCHTYVDTSADLAMAKQIVVNAKTQRPSVCNAMDTLLVHVDVAEEFVPEIAILLKEHNVTLHVDEQAASLCGDGSCIPIEAEDYDREWLSLDCSVRIVDSIDIALDHIDKHGSGHSEAIVTNSYLTAQRFQREADAAAIFVNASTYFHDGGQFGLGSELGISTQKMHARGPLGLKELTSYKWIVLGNGQIRH